MGPWIWLFGSCGAGKTATGHELFRQLTAAGRRVGYLELDQIGMCLPDEDELGYAIKSSNLLAALESFHEVGAEAVVVSGDLAGPTMEQVLAQCTTQPVLVRLRASARTYAERLEQRGAPQAYIDWSATYDETFTRSGDHDIDTDGRTVAQVAGTVLAAVSPWPPAWGPPPRADPQPATSKARGAAGTAVLLCGPMAVGKSTVAWELLMRSLSDSTKTAFLDLAHIGIVHGGLDATELRARNLARMWNRFAERGATRLVLNGHVGDAVELACYQQALPDVTLHVRSLSASTETLVARAQLRGAGQMIELPGDELRGQAPEVLTRLAREASELAGRSPHLPGAHQIPTDVRAPADIAEEIASQVFG
jgi:hypothetical protein